jgi:hypothetical protein
MLQFPNAEYGRCISCNKPVSDWREFDAGHFISAGGGGFALLFDEPMSTASAPTTAPLTKPTYSFIEEDLILGMALEQQTRLKKGIETAISRRQHEIQNSTTSKSSHSKRINHSEQSFRKLRGTFPLPLSLFCSLEERL